MSNDDEEKVGYCNPPTHSQYKPGRSGNPTGRPKKKPVPPTFHELLLETLTVEIDGKKRKITKQEISDRQVINNALKPDYRYKKLLYSRLDQIERTISRHEKDDEDCGLPNQPVVRVIRPKLIDARIRPRNEEQEKKHQETLAIWKTDES